MTAAISSLARGAHASTLPPAGAPAVHLVAVVGGSGAGKGWLIGRLLRLLGDKAGHLQLDAFYRDRSHLPLGRRARINYDRPAAIDWESALGVLQECRAGRPVQVPRYDFATYRRLASGATWQPRPIVFVDGLWLLRPPALRGLFDLRIYLDTPAPLRCHRRLARDVVERGYLPEAIEQQLCEAVLPMHARYVEPQKRRADLVLTQPFREAQLWTLADRLWALAARAVPIPPWQHETFRADLVELLRPGGDSASTDPLPPSLSSRP